MPQTHGPLLKSETIYFHFYHQHTVIVYVLFYQMISELSI